MEDKKLILIVDDEAELRNVLSIRLSESGYAVVEVSSGKEVVSMAKENKPKLIIMDIMMPDIDGMAASQQLKEDASTKDIPLIFLTGLQDKNTESPDHRSGDNIIFAKPYEFSELLIAVKKLIG